MNFLDLFAGIGGFRLGMEMAGHECVGYVEIDKFARKSYEAIFNTEGEWTAHDITRVTDDDIRFLRGQVDAICGGFPCQAFSIAGKRKGFEDTRGTLFFEIARFANIIRPRYLFLENVKGLLNHDDGNTFETILRTLDELGYDAEWDVLNSKDFGVPQNRERVFIIGHLRGGSTRKVFPIGRNATTTSIEIIGSTKGEHQTSHGQREQVYSPSGLIGALTATDYKQPKRIGLKQIIGGSQGMRVYDTEGLSCTLSSQGGGMGAKTGLYAVPVLTPDRLEKRQNGRRFKEDGEPMFTITAQDRHGIMIKEATKKGFDVATEGDSINLAVPGSKTRRGRVGKGVANTLDTSCNQGVLKGYRIRKLTPRECWRLQGFPDWAFDKAQEVNSDNQLYKQAGNSVTVSVIYEIAKKLN